MRGDTMQPAAIEQLGGGRVRIQSSRSGNWYTTDAQGGCTCVAAQRGILCWHVKWRMGMSDHEIDEAADKRRMPNNLRKHLIRMQGGKMYLPAAYRVVWFRDELGDEWGISTDLVEGGHEAGFATVKASILDPNGMVRASAHKTESKSDFPAGWVEKAESGAVARALAFLGFGTQFSQELEDDGTRPADSPQGRAQVQQPASNGGEIWEGPGQCPACHAPSGKRHGRQCLG